MRYLVGLMCVLALGVMPMVGCSDEETTGGTGGAAGDGGNGGEGGSDGIGLTDCTGAEDGTECAYLQDFGPGTSGRCLSEVCYVDDCAPHPPDLPEPVPLSLANCLAYGDGATVDYLGLCVDGTCVAPQDDCTGQAEGTPCWFDDGRSEMGTCDELGVCLEPAAPEIGYVSWDWGDSCDANAPGQFLQVQLWATDADTPERQLRLSVQVQDCTGPESGTSRPVFETTLTCDVYLGARQSEATATDPQGNQDTMFFAPDPCTDGCEGNCRP